MNAATRYLIALVIALGMSSAYLVDGPSEIDAMQATAASVSDAVTAANEVTR